MHGESSAVCWEYLDMPHTGITNEEIEEEEDDEIVQFLARSSAATVLLTSERVEGQRNLQSSQPNHTIISEAHSRTEASDYYEDDDDLLNCISSATSRLDSDQSELSTLPRLGQHQRFNHIQSHGRDNYYLTIV